jgi:hypothetical protein
VEKSFQTHSVGIGKKTERKVSSAEFSWYQETEINTPEIESRNKAKYEDWLKGLDVVLFTYGD